MGRWLLLPAAATLALATALSCGSDERPPPGADGPKGTLVVQLLAAGEPLAVIDVATGKRRVARAVRTAPGDPPVRIARTGGRVVYYGADGVYTIDPDLRRRPRKLGTPLYFVPSASEGRVWFAFPDARSPEMVRGLRSVAEVTVRGRVVTRSPVPPPCRGPSVAGAVVGAVLCQSRSGLVAFDPESGRVLRRLAGPFPLDTHGTRVAWCTFVCPRLHVTDLRSGGDSMVAPGAGFRFEASYEGAFSPDGRLLAVPVLAHRRKVALIDLDADSVRVVPGSRLGGYRNITWSRSGRWLFFEAGRGRLMAYRPGSERARLLPLRLRSQVLDLAPGRGP